jgi:hypothetical protein
MSLVVPQHGVVRSVGVAMVVKVLDVTQQLQSGLRGGFAGLPALLDCAARQG